MYLFQSKMHQMGALLTKIMAQVLPWGKIDRYLYGALRVKGAP